MSTNHNPPEDLSSNPYGYEYAPGNDFVEQKSNPNENADRVQRERRASIQAVMKDQSLTPLERRRSIQGLMDGRRRSTGWLPAKQIETTTGEKQQSPFELEKKRPICTHYERNCTIISPCCGMAFGCRICHDECEELPKICKKAPGAIWDDSSNNDDVDEESHRIDRHAIAEVICRECYTRQSSKTNRCYK